MNSAAAESFAWPTRRLWLVAALLVLIQIAFVFWLGDEAPIAARRAVSEPEIFWAPGYSDELIELTDPTLFAWANPHGFSGRAWLDIPPLEYQPFAWTEPPRFLEPEAGRLGGIFLRVVGQNGTVTFQIAAKPEPQIELPAVEELPVPLPTQSTVSVGGGLVGRRLLSKFDLPAWPAADILQDSVVRVMVDADGRTQSATLLSSSGSKEADQRALDLAKTAEWEPLRPAPGTGGGGAVAALTSGRLIFSWVTVPITNTPTTNP